MGGRRIVDGPKNPRDFRPTGSSIVDGPRNPRGFRPSRPSGQDLSGAEQQRFYNEQKQRRAEDKFKASQLRSKLQQYLAARRGFR